uniref:Association with the SNF1 complex (ASC) domain-containing protein n=2 Tax=Kalanchoe fedtschenkoi TaxID=63787 RepID=A0A7N0URL7_KALFE
MSLQVQSAASKMNNNRHVENRFGENHDEFIVPGFEAPPSPPSSYDNLYPPDREDVDAPIAHFQLPHTLLNHPAPANLSDPCPDPDSQPEPLPQPANPTVNHLYIDGNIPGPVIGLGATFRFREKFVTVMYYRTVPRTGSAGAGRA